MTTPHLIEQARSGRSRCRTCGQPIPKGELRLGVGHAQENGSHSHQWFHLTCGVTARPLALEEALLATSLVVPDRAVLEQGIADQLKQAPARTVPYAAGPGLDTYHCTACGNWSFPGTVRVFVAGQITVGGVTLDRHLPVDHGCANALLGDNNLLETVVANSGALDPDTETWLRDGSLT